MTDNAYLVISPVTGLVAAVLDQERAEQLARDYRGVVCAVEITFDGRSWKDREAE